MSLIPSIKLFVDQTYGKIENAKNKLMDWIPLELNKVTGTVKKVVNELGESGITKPPLISKILPKPIDAVRKFVMPSSYEMKQKYVAEGMPEAEADKQAQKDMIQFSVLGMGSGLENVAKKAGGEFVETKLAKKAFTGFKDLTTKVLEKLKGRSTVSKQFISDLTNAPDLKQVERDVIRNVLDSHTTDQIPVQEFADKVKSELLPLTKINTKSSPVWENVVLPDELRGNIANYTEHIWESPIKTSAGQTHFGLNSRFEGRSPSNYFGHTRIEEMAPDYMPGKKVVRIIENQSDLYQKGGLEQELPHNPDMSRFKIENIFEDKQSGLWKVKDTQGGEVIAETKQKLINDITNKPSKQDLNRIGQIQKLQQYNDPTAHFRIQREEIKNYAQQGYDTMLVPTGETAMKIEGLGEQEGWTIKRFPKNYEAGGNFDIEKLTPDKLKVGERVWQGEQGQGRDWIITDILGDGKFKAVPKELAGMAFETGGGGLDRVVNANGIEGFNTHLRHFEETFDISGKVDTNNPIYRFYEKDLGRYLKSKYNAQMITDNKGVNWWQLDIKPEQAKAPVEAFGALPLLGALQKDNKDYNKSNGKIPFLDKLNKPLFINK